MRGVNGRPSLRVSAICTGSAPVLKPTGNGAGRWGSLSSTAITSMPIDAPLNPAPIGLAAAGCARAITIRDGMLPGTLNVSGRSVSIHWMLSVSSMIAQGIRPVSGCVSFTPHDSAVESPSIHLVGFGDTPVEQLAWLTNAISVPRPADGAELTTSDGTAEARESLIWPCGGENQEMAPLLTRTGTDRSMRKITPTRMRRATSESTRL